jgi:hypothetical protein
VVGGYAAYNDFIESDEIRNCTAPDVHTKLRELLKRHPPDKSGTPALLYGRVQYILTTANNWSGPIRKFRLTITPPGPEDLVLTCVPGLQRTAGGYEVQRTNFRPDRELDLIIYTTAPRPTRMLPEN